LFFSRPWLGDLHSAALFTLGVTGQSCRNCMLLKIRMSSTVTAKQIWSYDVTTV
jgi:hypothetical protein